MFDKMVVRGLSTGVLVATMLIEMARAQIVAPNLPIGSKYQILFVTSTGTTATSSNIEDYNSFVQSAASLDSSLPSATWSAVASTFPSYNAYDASNTSTIPIYDMHGDLLEPNFLSLFSDGTFPGPEYDENGAEDLPNLVWTGSAVNGREDGAYALGGPFGYTECGGPLPGGIGPHGWLAGQEAPQGRAEPLYAISSPITVVPEPSTVFLLIAGAACVLSVVWRKRCMHCIGEIPGGSTPLTRAPLSC